MSEQQQPPPIEGRAIRFAPRRDTMEPASSIWKVWAAGNEVYALARSTQGLHRISVHRSGAIHCRMGAKHKQDFAPLMPLGGGPWSHAVKIRFLLDRGALAPFNQREALKNKTAYLIRVPEGEVLYGNLIIGKAGLPLDCAIPNEFFGGGVPFWRTRLSDGRIAVLAARFLPLDETSREAARQVREGLKLTFTSMPKNKYGEIHHMFWGVGGNIVLVVPLGEQAFLSEEDIQHGAEPDAPARTFHYHHSRSGVDLVAPDGQRVASIELQETHLELELIKGAPKVVDLGRVTLRIEARTLMAGSKFIGAPCKLACTPAIGGGSPRDWAYFIRWGFDGSRLSVELHRLSAALRNENLAAPIARLEGGEELVLSIPPATLNLEATFERPEASAELLGRFTLRNET